MPANDLGELYQQRIEHATEITRRSKSKSQSFDSGSSQRCITGEFNQWGSVGHAVPGKEDDQRRKLWSCSLKWSQVKSAGSWRGLISNWWWFSLASKGRRTLEKQYVPAAALDAFDTATSTRRTPRKEWLKSPEATRGCFIRWVTWTDW